MAKRVSELRTANKAGNTSREYVLLSNIDSNSSTKLALNDIFPTLQSGKVAGGLATTTTSQSNLSPVDLFVGGGVGSSTANTDKSVLIFKGIAADDRDGALTLRTDKSTADGTRQNVVVALDQTAIKLNQAVNTTSKFLSEPGGSNPLNLTDTATYSGNLPVSRGGTGASTYNVGGLLVGNGTSAVSSLLPMATDVLLLGAGVGSNPTQLLPSSTVGEVLSITASGVAWSKPKITTATLTSTLLMNNNSINLGTGYLTGTGSSAGISLSNSSDYTYIGGGSKYFTSRLNVDGDLTLGSYAGTAAQNITLKACASGASPTFTIKGSDNADANNGGNLVVQAGGGAVNNDGGDLTLGGGTTSGTGTAGSLYLQTAGTTALSVDENQDVNVTNNLTLNQGKTLELRGTETVTQLTSLTTAVTLNATAGVIQLYAASLSGHDSVYFTFNNTLINSRSIILLTPEMDAAEVSGAGLVCQIAARAAGTVQIRVSNTGNAATSTNHAIHFLIMNVYV
jgi:hypothetical protein